MEEFHVQITDRFALVGDHQAPVAGKFAQHGRFHVEPAADFQNPFQIFGRHGQHHSLLAFGNPDFPGLQPGIFQGGALQLHPDPRLGPHFAQSGAKPPCPAVGDGPDEPGRAGLQDGVAHPFFFDGVADLHGAGVYFHGPFRHFAAGKGGPVNSVAARPSADDQGEVAGAGFSLLAPVFW